MYIKHVFLFTTGTPRYCLHNMTLQAGGICEENT